LAPLETSFGLVTFQNVKEANSGTGGVIQFFVCVDPGTIATCCKISKNNILYIVRTGRYAPFQRTFPAETGSQRTSHQIFQLLQGIQ